MHWSTYLRHGMLVVDVRYGVLVVVDLDVLLEFAVLVPLFDLNNILDIQIVSLCTITNPAIE